MASPWRFLTRLVLPRRQERQEDGSIDDVKAVKAIAKTTETTADKELNAADPPIDEKPVAHDQSEAVSADPDRSAATASGIDAATDMAAATFLKASVSALSDEANMVRRVARKHLRIGEAATRKRSKRGKNAEIIKTVPPPSRIAVADDEVALDEEIRLLRDQLARKLHLQNAQLKRMLDRFER